VAKEASLDAKPSMIAYVLRSLAQAVLVLLAVGLIAFCMFRFVGDPVANLVGQEASQADRRELAERLGLNDPIIVQFARFVGDVTQGEFGISYRHGRKVSALIAEKLPATVELAMLSALFATSVGIVLGVYTATRRDGWLSHVIMTTSLIGVSLPTFLIGIGLIYLFAVELRWLPSFGRGETVQLGWWTTGLFTESGRLSLIMPVLTLGFYQLTLIMRLVRAQMLETLRTDYVKFARARGLPERRIHYKHALRNTLIPVVTIAGLQLGSVVAFAIVTESVFQWPGLGALFVQAVQFVDIPVMAAYLLFVAVVFVIVNLIVDLLYYALDPRLRTGRLAAAK
jgi:peptide/nickel transport system permease protein